MVKYLVEDARCRLEVFDAPRSSPLHNACRNGHHYIVKNFVYNITMYSTSCELSIFMRTLLSSRRVDPNGLTLGALSLSEITRDPVMKQTTRNVCLVC